MSEKRSNFPTFELEQEAYDHGYKAVIGIDEAGRGSLIHSVVAAAVYIPPDVVDGFKNKINDSKKLSVKRREELYDLIMEKCSVGVGSIGNDIIDEINILEATKLAMANAASQIEDPNYDYILVDGTVNLSKHVWTPAQQVIKGDTLSISIAAASIIAKVTRDREMLKIHEEWPIYEIDKHKGYGTKRHKELIALYGPCVYHRQTFGGVKEHINNNEKFRRVCKTY